MNFSGEYAKQYDQIHGQKDYSSEVENILGELKRRGFKTPCSVLDFGCGTGSHAALLKKMGFLVFGYDQNPDMIAVAREKNSAGKGHFTNNLLDLEGQFQVVYSLFDVINYQLSEEDLDIYINQLDSNLEKGGLLILDSWNKSGVMIDPPKPTTRSYTIEGKEFMRKVTPSSLDNFETTSLTIDLVDMSDRKIVKTEIHKMRAFSPEKLTEVLTKKGFIELRIFDLGNWESQPQEASWKFGVSAIKS
jgi:SAM-dependent methyltransferase